MYNMCYLLLQSKNWDRNSQTPKNNEMQVGWSKIILIPALVVHIIGNRLKIGHRFMMSYSYESTIITVITGTDTQRHRQL